MDFDRVYAIHQFFSHRRYPATLAEILDHLEISKNTFHIARHYRCDVLGAPIKNQLNTVFTSLVTHVILYPVKTDAL